MSSTIQDNATVQLHYTLMVDGAELQSTTDTGPFSYVHGKGEIIPGLERQLIGLKAGDQREFTVSAEDGYGEINPAAIVEVPKEALPQDLVPEVGVVLSGQGPDGRPFRGTIRKVSDESVTLDLNHPLAGKTLLFKVKVLDVSLLSE